MSAKSPPALLRTALRGRVLSPLAFATSVAEQLCGLADLIEAAGSAVGDDRWSTLAARLRSAARLVAPVR